MKLNKDDIYGIVGSVAFHLFILLILGFTVLKTVVPDEDGGILVNFGNVNAAAGTFEPKYTGQEPPQETTTPPPPVPEPKVETPKEDLVTQEIEESVAIEETKKKKEKEEQRKKEEEKKRKYSSQRSQNRNSPAASSPSPARRNQQKRGLPSCTTVSRNAVRPAGEETQKNGSPRTVEENHLSKVQYSIFSHLFVFTFTRVAAHFYPLYVYLPGSLQILSGICACTPWRRIFICLLPF